MPRRVTACFCLLWAAVPTSANAAPHFVFGLDPRDAYDVRAGGQIAAQGVIPGPAGEIQFAADPSLAIVIQPAGTPPPNGGDTSPPSVPGGLAAAADQDRVDLSWSGSPEPDLAGYILYRRETEQGAPPPVTIGGIRAVSYADTSVRADVEYAYAIAARDSTGNVSAPSAEVRVRPALQGFLPEVSALHGAASIDSVLGSGRCQARLSWTAQVARRFAGFAVDRSSDAGATWERRTQAPIAGAGPFAFQEELAAGSYLYRIVAVSPRGYELPFDPLALTWDGRSLGPPVAGPFPNPSAGSITLRFALAEPARVRVALYDLAGRLLGVLRDAVESPGQHPWTWDRSRPGWRSLPSGVYLLDVDAGGTRLVRKVIVRK